MRKVIQEQMKFGEVAISDVKFDIRSRDEIPKLLLGLQEVYCKPSNQVFILPRRLITDICEQGL